jgi:ribonuclease BN (tRNA processing enzyme)
MAPPQRDQPAEPPTIGARTLTVLGCDGSYPGPGGAASGYLLASGTTSVWLDAGPGTFARLQQVCEPSRLDAVVLSHEHPDHWSDVDSFSVWALLHHEGQPPVPVYAPPGLRQRSYFCDHGSLDWREIEPGQRLEIGRLAFTFSRTDHGPLTLAALIEDLGDPAGGGGEPRAGADGPATLVYSADSGDGWSARELGTGIGTLLCEASYTREREGSFQHMSGRQAGTMAADVGTEHLVLTHRWPTVRADVLADEAGEHFGRPVRQAAAGKVFEW